MLSYSYILSGHADAFLFTCGYFFAGDLGAASAVIVGDSYLTVAAADAMAATMQGLSSYKAASDQVKAQHLPAASQEIDVAMRYQGQKFHLRQKLEFPRIAYGDFRARFSSFEESLFFFRGFFGRIPDVVWDWDETAKLPVVPQRVLQACLIQADSNIAAIRDERLDAIHDGLIEQRSGSMNERYITGDFDVPVLCRRADQIMQYYRLRSGRLE
jgi:hypothetical protein